MSIGAMGEKPKSHESINYGTHTLPKEFWTSGKGTIRDDSAFKARRKAKALRHYQNKANRGSGVDSSSRKK